MSKLRAWVIHLACGFFCAANAQAPLSLDTTFRCGFSDWYVNSLIALEDGNVLMSGRMRLPGELEQTTVELLDNNGIRVEPFYNSGLGGGRLTRWNDRFYVATTQTVRRILPTGHIDPEFAEMNVDPTFTSFQGGDYHVYPDGRLLISGLHDLIDEQGVGRLHSLIWFTDSGWVDYSRTHRRSNAAVYQIEEEPDGQFLCFYTGTEYEEQPTNGRIFRINADGTLDPTLESRVTSGTVYNFLPLSDGRFYATGRFVRSGTVGTIRLARFLPNGDLDPAFNNAIDFDRGELPDPGGFGATVSLIQPWENGSVLVGGTFRFVSDEPRGSLCVLDSTGALRSEFDACAVGGFEYEGLTSASVGGYLETPDGMAYIWGAYHGYNDGTTNDTLQRFVSRLYGPDWSTQVREEEMPTRGLALFPNPAQEQFIVSLADGHEAKQIRVRDHLGRVVLERPIGSSSGQLVVDTGALAPGAYLVEIHDHGSRLTALQLVLQP